MDPSKKVITTYEPYSTQPEYIKCNREFIESLPTSSAQWILDLACGTGTLSDVVLDKRSDSSIIGLDLSRESLLIGRRHFIEKGVMGGDFNPRNKPITLLIEGTADCIPLKELSVDAVIMGNSFHTLPDKNKLLNEVRRVLRPGGFFAFNTAFFAGTYPPGTEKVYHEWLKQALLYIGAKDAERKLKGLPRIPRQRGTVGRAFSDPWPSPEDFSRLLKENGFSVTSLFERTVMMNQQSFETVGAYSGMAKVLLSGYPVEIASEALQAAAKPAFNAFDIIEIPRLWLEVVSQRV